MKSGKTILTVKDVIELLSVSESWVRSAVANRTIPYYKPNKKTIYFKRSEIQDYALSNRIATLEEELTKYSTKQQLKRRK